MTGITQFLELVDAYSTSTGLAESTISTKLFNDGKRIDLIRSGRDVGVRKVEDAVAWFATHWPAGAKWPRHVARPEVEST